MKMSNNYRQSRRGTQRVIDEALGRVEAVITVGGRELAVTGVTIGQRISFSSSLKVAVSEVCQFAAQGELTVSAEYGSK